MTVVSLPEKRQLVLTVPPTGRRVQHDRTFGDWREM
jgi:hypothetical protein